MNIWLEVSPADLSRIKRIVNTLHDASLMLDDVEDGSSLRRGKAAVHTVFGPALTINSAGHQVVAAIAEVRQLKDEHCMEIFLGKCSVNLSS
jgi:geranylgeranyl pyrophosphate synthase